MFDNDTKRVEELTEDIDINMRNADIAREAVALAKKYIEKCIHQNEELRKLQFKVDQRKRTMEAE